jgi:hypothetical protein
MTAPETKSFTLADILTHTTGRLLTPIGDVYLFLEWVTGEQGVMTHQLPRLSREVTPFLEKTFPDLAAIDIAAVPISSQADVDALMARLGWHGGSVEKIQRLLVARGWDWTDVVDGARDLCPKHASPAGQVAS